MEGGMGTGTAGDGSGLRKFWVEGSVSSISNRSHSLVSSCGGGCFEEDMLRCPR